MTPGMLRSSLLAGFLSLAAAACDSSGTTQAGAHVRPAFAQEFPDVTELVRTADVAGAKERLGRVDFPETDAHHEALLALVADAKSLDVEHLELLIHAVALPGSLGQRDEDIFGTFVHIEGDAKLLINGRELHLHERGEASYSHVVDELLLAAADKLTGLERADVGFLLGRTESNDALHALSQRWLPRFDDGSAPALAEILAGFDRRNVIVDFINNELLPSGGVDGDRLFVAVEAVPVDADRLAVLQAALLKREALDATGLHACLDLLRVDANRLRLVREQSERVTPIDAAFVEGVLDKLSVDANRRSALELLAPSARIASMHDASALAGRLSVDANRLAGLQKIAQQLEGELTAAELEAAVLTLSVDANRIALLKSLAPRLRAGCTEAELTALIATASVDANRLTALRALREPALALSEQARERLAATLSVRANVTAARRELDL